MLVEFYSIIACLSFFVGMRKSGRIDLVIQRRLAHSRHEHNIAKIGTARTIEVRMRKSVDYRIRIMVTRTAIPTAVNAGIGRQLHHAKRNCCARKGMAVSASSDKGIHILAIGLGLGNACKQYNHEEKNAFFHVSNII